MFSLSTFSESDNVLFTQNDKAELLNTFIRSVFERKKYKNDLPSCGIDESSMAPGVGFLPSANDDQEKCAHLARKVIILSEYIGDLWVKIAKMWLHFLPLQKKKKKN